MRATVEMHETSTTLPLIKVRVSLGTEDLTIKVNEDTMRYDRLEHLSSRQHLYVLYFVLSLLWVYTINTTNLQT